MLNSCLNGDGDIFDEIKAMRKHAQAASTTIDGVNQDIPGHFKGIDSKLYNSHSDQTEIEALEDDLENRINITH